MMMTMMMEVVVVKMIMVVVVEVVMVVTITLGPRTRAMGAQNDFTPAEGWDRAFKLQDSGFTCQLQLRGVRDEYWKGA